MTIRTNANYTSDGKEVRNLTRVGDRYVGYVGPILRAWNELGEQVNSEGQVMGNTQNYLKEVRGDA